jgi:phosphoribosylformimino-5-aminoimidazole carboxamide ribotide isomerase
VIIIPAVDIKGGRCVRLEQGRMDAETVYSEDPVEVATRWASAGAALIHIVDLDAAVTGRPVNFDIVERIISTTGVPVQVGGGIRDANIAGIYLTLGGVKRVILGTAAYEDPGLIKELSGKYPGRVAVGIDARGGKVAIKGWLAVTDRDAVTLAREFEGLGIACIIYTDISRDGMLAGPNLDAMKEMTEAVDIPVVASGGISSLEDIELLKGLDLEGAIIGKALYSGAIELKQAIAKARG